MRERGGGDVGKREDRILGVGKEENAKEGGNEQVLERWKIESPTE